MTPICAELCSRIFNEAILAYHQEDNVDAPMPQYNHHEETIEYLLFKKNWIDTVQWHLEDIIRHPEIDPVAALEIKRRIDKSNQDRTNIVEVIDEQIQKAFEKAKVVNHATINTETPAWAIDRLSILNIKIFHMAEEFKRKDASSQHIAQCQQKHAILLIQHDDLCKSIDELLADIKLGNKKMRLYKQMKMYNDPNLNPILYQKNK